MDYLSNKWIDIKNKWNSLNKKGKALVCAVAIIIAVFLTPNYNYKNLDKKIRKLDTYTRD